jgi:eukaryotic-like serine/threonine-protein kinase
MKRRLVLGGLAGWSLGAAAQAMFRADAAHSGVYAGAGPGRFTRQRWSFPTGDRIVSSPAYEGGVLFFGSDDGHCYAVDAASGRERWRYRTGGPVASSPALAGGRVFFISYDGRVYALDAATGALVWKFATAGEKRFEARGLHGFQPKAQTYADMFDVYLSSPVVTPGADGTVYVGSGDGRVYALDAATGTRRWATDTGEVVHASPALAAGLVIVGNWKSTLLALDAKTGAERWRFQAGTDDLIHNQVGFQGSPAIADGIVYVGCRDSHLYAIDLASGRERWKFSTGQSWVITSPAIAHGRVYFATSDSSLIHALDAKTGQPAWQQSSRAYVFGSPAVVGETLLVPVLNGTLEARDAATGALRWEWRTPASAANEGWALTAERALNGPWLYPSNWREHNAAGFLRQHSPGGLFASPVVGGGVVYIGSSDGRLYALETSPA